MNTLRLCSNAVYMVDEYTIKLCGYLQVISVVFASDFLDSEGLEVLNVL